MRGVDIYQIGFDIHYFLHQSGIVGSSQRELHTRDCLLIRCDINDVIDRFDSAKINIISRCFDREIMISESINKKDPFCMITIDDTQKDQDHDDISYDEQNVYENLLNFFKADEDFCYTITTKNTVFMHISIKNGHKKSKKMIKNELNVIRSDLGYDVYDLIGFGKSGEKKMILCIDRKAKINDEKAFGDICIVLGQNSEVLKQKKYRDLICKYINEFKNK